MLTSQRRSLAELSFRVASMLPDPGRSNRDVAVHASTAVATALRSGSARAVRVLATTTEAVRSRPLANGLATGVAAVAIGAVVLAATREAALTSSSPIGPRIANAAPVTNDAAAAAIATPTAVPTPQPSVLEQQCLVTMYGYPHVTTMGLLGTFANPRDAAREVKRMAAELQAADGRPTIGALHVIAHVAQADQTTDGTHIARIGDTDLRPWVDVAREEGVLLILDTQIGWSDALTETKRLKQWLKLPFVHLALDPEFALARGVAPGEAIGSLDGASVNAVQAYVGDLVRREGLPHKMLMLHQFMEHMLTGTRTYASDPDIEIVVDFDGWGPVESKIEGYSRYAASAYAERPAMKLFTDPKLARSSTTPR